MTEKESEKKFEESLKKSGKERYILRLYVSGMTPKSLRAVANVKKICEEQLRGRYELEVVDIYQQPELAKIEEIVAAPTLIKNLPLPLRKFIGDLSDTERLFVGLNLTKKMK